MPFYEFDCDDCGEVFEVLLSIQARNIFTSCKCGGEGHRLIAAPNVQEWNKDRRFPNLRKDGDGAMSFDSKSDYKKYLVENNICELSTDAKKYNKPLNKVIGKPRAAANRVTPRNRVEAI